MSDKWQQINLRLDAPLAQALRELKQGHDESLSEVVIRLLRKVVRVVPAGSRGAHLGRQNAGGTTGRGAAGGKRRGKAAAAGRGAARVAAPGKPWVTRAAGAWGTESEKGEPARPRAARRGGKPSPASWAPAFESAGEPRRRGFRAGAGKPAARPSDALGGEGRTQRPRPAKRRRTSGR